MGSLIEIVLSRFIDKLEGIITPTVTGIVITVIGLSLVKVGFTDMAGGFGAKDFGALPNLGLAMLVVAVIVGFSFARHDGIRLSAVLIGLLVGFAVAFLVGKVDFSKIGASPVRGPGAAQVRSCLRLVPVPADRLHLPDHRDRDHRRPDRQLHHLGPAGEGPVTSSASRAAFWATA